MSIEQKVSAAITENRCINEVLEMVKSGADPNSISVSILIVVSFYLLVLNGCHTLR